MNNDLISRSVALNAILTSCNQEIEKYKSMRRALGNVGRAAFDSIKALPAVDAEPVRHGRWIRQDDTFTRYMCSECESRNHADRANYCPNCGAKMDLEEDTNG